MQLFLNAATTAPAREWVAEVLAPARPEIRSALLESVEASVFSLSQWIEALAAFSVWLDSRKGDASLEDRIAYLECCAATAGPLDDLPGLLQEMLQTHGCEAAKKRGCR